jgi:hypothetical protein
MQTPEPDVGVREGDYTIRRVLLLEVKGGGWYNVGKTIGSASTIGDNDGTTYASCPDARGATNRGPRRD